MALKVENLSTRPIGIGEVNVLPGEAQVVPTAYEHNPILEIYKKLGFIKLSGKAETKEATAEEIAAAKEEEEAKAQEEAEELRKQRLASLEGISEEDLGKLANELGINLATCKTQADVLKKVKAALRK